MSTNVGERGRLRISVSRPEGGQPLYLWSLVRPGEVTAGVTEQDPVLIGFTAALGEAAVLGVMGNRRCHSRQHHGSHTWWSRQRKGYFLCPGRIAQSRWGFTW